MKKFEKEFPDELIARLRMVTEELAQWNRKFSLTAVPDNDIFEKLIAPSAWLGLQYAGENEKGLVADFGCGPGVPGVGMALADNLNRYLLLDSNRKKIGFVKHLLTLDGLFDHDNLTAQVQRVAPGQWDDKADGLVTRGTGSMAKTLLLWAGKIAPGAPVDFFKSQAVDDEVKELGEIFPDARVERMKTPDWFGSLSILRVRLQEMSARL